MKLRHLHRLCVALVVCLFLMGCQTPRPPENPNTPDTPGNPDNPENPENPNDPGKEEPMKPIELSEKSKELYRATYQTLLDRLLENGYAQTSLTGAYVGMFVRDASIQAMAHLANGDVAQAERVLRYMVAYHKAIGADFSVHIMNPLTAEAVYDSVRGEVMKSSDARETTVAQTDSSTALYRITSPTNRAAQSFTALSDTIAEISVSMKIPANSGKLRLSVGTAPDDASVGSCEYAFSKAEAGWVTFRFEKPLTVKKNSTYYFTIDAEANGNVVVMGKLNTAPASYNYDLAAYGGWRKQGGAMAFKVCATSTVTEDPDASLPALSYGASVGKIPVSRSLHRDLRDKYVTGLRLYLSANGTPAADETYTVTLKKGDVVVDTLTRRISTLSEQAAPVDFLFCLPVTETDADADYTVEISAGCADRVVWYGPSENDLYYRANISDPAPYSRKIQVDGNYMLVNAYAIYALQADGDDELTRAAYPLMRDYALYFTAEENGYFAESGLLRNPNYEHSRNGRYWDDYDLITNCFASEAFHKMSAVAKRLGYKEDAENFSTLADTIAHAVHENLTCEFHGKTIYTELIALDEGGKVYKGFSFVSLAPLAADWYATNAEIMANTYEMYLKYGTDNYGGHDMLAVVVTLDEDDNVLSHGSHVIGKGLAWELHYLWQTGNTERLADMLAFVDEWSRQTYPEVWVINGDLHDSANQEQASWMLYEIARISGMRAK